MSIMGFPIDSTIILIGVVLLVFGLIRKIKRLIIFGIIVAVIATIIRMGPEIISAATWIG